MVSDDRILTRPPPLPTGRKPQVSNCQQINATPTTPKSTSPTKFIQKIIGCALRAISRLPRARNEPSRNSKALRQGRIMRLAALRNHRIDLRHRAQLEHPYLARQCQHLHEQPVDLLEKAPPKRRDRVVIGMVVGRDEAERHRIIRCTLQLPAGKHACGVAVNQNAQQQCWVIGRRSRTPIAPAHRRQVKPVNHLNDEPRQMSLRKPVIHRRRQKEASLAVNRAEIAQKRATQRGRKAESMQRFYPTPLSPTGC